MRYVGSHFSMWPSLGPLLIPQPSFLGLRLSAVRSPQFSTGTRMGRNRHIILWHRLLGLSKVCNYGSQASIGIGQSSSSSCRSEAWLLLAKPGGSKPVSSRLHFVSTQVQLKGQDSQRELQREPPELLVCKRLQAVFHSTGVVRTLTSPLDGKVTTLKCHTSQCC